MTPRPRARGTEPRGRGKGRERAASTLSAAGPGDASTPAPPTAEEAVSGLSEEAVPGTSDEAIIPKKETDGNATSGAPGAPENISATMEAQSTPSAVASSIPVPETTDSSARAPVQRLASLKNVEPSSRSGSPSLRRGSSTKGKKVAPKPTFTGRRSKEERDKLDKADREREKERNRERDALEARKRRDKEWEEKRAARAASRGRGGYGGVVSGPFSLGSSTQERKTNHRGTGGYGAGSGSRAVRVKREGGEYTGGSGGSGIKREVGAYASSEDDEEEAEFPRKDIDLIEISSDEDDLAASAHGGKATLPVRIGRKEHQDRVIGINTEASNETAAKILQQAQATGQTPKADAVEGLRKGKGKSKDLEITSVRKPFKGMWQDSDESQTEVKAEPASDDEMGDAEQVGIIDPADKVVEKTEPSSPTTERKPKARRKSVTEPILQTDEERAEWARFQSNLQHIRAELGPDETLGADASGDTAMTDPAANASKPSVRDNNVYLFQIPPLMPELLQPGIKNESDAQVAGMASSSDPPAKSDAVPIKVEEGFSDPSARLTQGPRFASGHVGKLRVRQSGRTTLDWGGTSYELTPGNKASFLQEVVSLNVASENLREPSHQAGEAVSFGRVKGKFVVVPDWNDMLG